MDIKELYTALQKELALAEHNLESAKQFDLDSNYWTGYLAALNYADDLLLALSESNSTEDYIL